MNAHGARRWATGTASAVQITFDGEPLSALETDTVAGALIAAGHRVFTIDPHDGVTTVRDGMRVETQQGHGHWDGEGQP
jgi:hypothetical protein